MKLLLILSVVATLTFAKENYSTENDNFDIEALINDPKSLEAFLGCFFDRNECGPIALFFKKDIGEAVREACAKCNPAQKHILKRFLEGLKEKLPHGYQEFLNNYDPEGKFLPVLQQELVTA